MKVRRAAMILLAAAAMLGGCRQAERPLAALLPATAEVSSHEAGRKIYNFRCYYCHGYSGDARTLSATMLDPKPRDFTSPTALEELNREHLKVHGESGGNRHGVAAAPGGHAHSIRDHMIETVAHGKRGTAMQAFGSVLSDREIEQVVDFVLTEFVERRAPNTRYHTAGNGWPDHERYAVAFPFATGQIALDTASEQLTPAQVQGRRLYLGACVSCHDRGRVERAGEPWQASAR